jgi:DNA-binding response OmpR family regulator
MQEVLPACTLSLYANFRLLIVDADANVCAALAQQLTSAGYAVQASVSGCQALRLLEQICFDVLVIDPVLPDMAGQTVLEQARHCSPDMVIILLTGSADLESIVGAIRCGVNGYLSKSARFSEMMVELMRILHEQLPCIRKHASLRVLREVAAHWRASESLPGAVIETATVRCADQITHIRLDRERRVVQLQREGIVREIALTYEEMAILQALMARASDVLARDQLAAVICPAVADDHRVRGLVRHYVHHLRRKIELDPARPRIIRTVRGKGYLLDAVPVVLPSAAR